MTAERIFEVADSFLNPGGKFKNVIRIQISTNTNDKIYLQSYKQNGESAYRNMSVSIDDIDDMVVALQYAKKILVDRAWKPREHAHASRETRDACDDGFCDPSTITNMDWISGDG